MAIAGRGSVWRRALADRLVCFAAAAVAFAGYLYTLAPSVAGEDSGELTAAGWVLGIPHPPGYPLWCLLAYPVMHGLEVGSVAWRANLVSAIFGSIGVWLVAETVLTLLGRRLAAFGAALALGFSQEYWQQSVAAEVYTLSAALVALHILLMARWAESRRDATLYAAAFVAGLATAHYTLNAVLLPAAFLYMFATDLRPRRWRRYGWFVACSLPGWLIYLYLPIRSLADPAADWGNPETWSNFVDVVTRAQYRDLVVATAPFGPDLPAHLANSGRQLAHEFTPWVGAAALIGLVLWLGTEFSGRGDRMQGPGFPLYLTGAALGLAAGAQFAPNYPMEYHWEWVRTPYWLPVILVGSIYLGYLLSINLIRLKLFYISITLVAISSPIVVNIADANRRGEHVADTYARGLLEGLAPDAIYFGGGDHTIFPLVYMQVAEGVRPDVVLANRYGYIAPAAYAAAGEAPPAGRPAPGEEDRILQVILANTTRPVYSAAPRLVPNVTRVNEGLLYRYLRPGEARADNPPMDVPVAVLDTRGDWSNELIAHEYYAARGRALFDAGRPSEALDALDRAARYVHEDKSALNNLGLNAAEGGEVAAAAVYFHRALTTDPTFLPAALNLARCYLTQNTPQEAIAVLENLEAKGARDARLDEMKRAALAALNGH